MGVDIRDLVEFKEIKTGEMCNKTIAIDAFNIIFQFITTIRQADGTPLLDNKGEVTSHLAGIFYRNMNLLENGVKLLYVFDGKPPVFKVVTEEREKRKQEAEKKYEEALKREDFEEALKFAKQTARLSKPMITQSKELLSAMGIQSIQAPSEGEAQAAHLTKKKDAFAVGSQDYDSLLFGAKQLIRNLNSSGKRKIPGRNVWLKVSPEIVSLSDVLSKNKLTQEQLVSLGILAGTDYCPQGVKGIGPKKALVLVKEHKTPEKIFSHVQWEHEIDPIKIFEWFMHPLVDENYEIKPQEFDKEKIMKILVDRHNFSAERISGRILKFLEESKKNNQKPLSTFFS